MAPPSALPEWLSFDAKPYAFSFPPKRTALVVIDMQRDFLLEGGFGEIQGGNLTAVQACIPPTRQLLDIFRGAGLHVVHTREGHLPDLSDCPSSKLIRQKAMPGNTMHKMVIGERGPMGRLLTRGEYGHDIVDELQPLPGELVIDKPGKGSFWNTRLLEKLQAMAVTHLIVAGVTTECCFQMTIREANDRGFECCGIAEATAGYADWLKTSTLDLLPWSQGLFGFVGHLQPLVDSLSPYQRSSACVSQNVSWDGDLSISALQNAYRQGLSPVDVMKSLYSKIVEYQKIDSAVWIHLQPLETILRAMEEAQQKYPDKSALPPLFGIPFSVKDSIDVSGLPTTTACPPLAFTPTKSAHVYTKCIEAGAILIGKTNLDQFATGLSGARSPFGITRSVYSKEYISGGSSSGSAVSVGAGLVSFSIGTDTAGSGRVPAAFNGVVGFKPTRGTVSFTGITPACLSLDCASFLTANIDDARTVWNICEGYDPEDRYSKSTPPTLRPVHALGSQSTSFNFGIPPPEALAICSPAYQEKFAQAVAELQKIGGRLTPVDWTPFEKAGQLLYDGTFVSERIAGLPDGWLELHRGQLHHTIREIFEQVAGRNSTAVQVFRDLQARALYTRAAEEIFTRHPEGIITLVVPTTPTHFTVDEMLADPLKRNSFLGTFTHCANVLDLAGVAMPSGTYTTDNGTTLPFGVTLLGGTRTDGEILAIAERFQEQVAAAGL